jgi:hypothetical protein
MIKAAELGGWVSSRFESVFQSGQPRRGQLIYMSGGIRKGKGAELSAELQRMQKDLKKEARIRKERKAKTERRK